MKIKFTKSKLDTKTSVHLSFSEKISFKVKEDFYLEIKKIIWEEIVRTISTYIVFLCT